MEIDYQKLPKVELHLHLDGSVRLTTLKELTNLSDEEIYRKCVSSDSKNLKDYLTKFTIPLELMQTKDNITRITKELIEDLKKDNVIYAEIRFAPYLHTRGGLSYYEVIESVLKATQNNKTPKINFILCMLKNLDENENRKVIDYARIFLNHGIGGVDLAGDESMASLESYKELFKYAKSRKVPFTIHQGEVSSKGLDIAISLAPKRIGHGIKIIDDCELLEKMKKSKITLEICPTSNINTKAFSTVKDLPIKKLFDLGIPITINTDNRTVSNTNLNKEYELLAKEFHFTKEDFIKMNKNAIKASFLPYVDKLKLEILYDELVK